MSRLAAGVAWGRRGDLMLLAIVVLASTLLHAVLVAQPRYAIPLLGLLAAGGASGLSAMWGRRDARPAVRRLGDMDART